VIPERPGRCELTQLVTDHGFGDIHRNVTATVMDRNGVTDHVRNNGRTTRPGLDNALLSAGVKYVYLLQEVVVDKWTFFQTARHLG
jgi:hypothetical protein